jgi:hypothetical protein
MLTDEERAYLGRMTMAMQIVVGALAAGIVSFLVVVLVIGQPQAPLPGDRLLTYLSVAVGLVAVVVALILPGVIVRNNRQAVLEGKATASTPKQAPPLPETLREIGSLATGYQTALIVRSALLEGAAFFALVAFMLQQQKLSLIVAGALLLSLLGGFPTRSKLEDAIHSDRRTLKQLRQMEPQHAR